MIIVACPCGQKLRVADEASGKKVKCPGCGQVSAVPVKVAAGAVGQEATMPPATASSPIVGKPPTPSVSGNDVTVAPAPSATQDTGMNDSPRKGDALGDLTWLGGYKIVRQLGQGGMGAVYEAEDVKLERRVALKVMKPEIAKNEQHRTRFVREAKTAAKVESDFICPIYQVGEEQGIPFIAMPFLKGESLDAPLKNGTSLPIAEIVRIGKEVAEGLSAAHEAGLIHRDIKPANVWLETQRNGPPRARILDFGLARAQAEDVQITQSGAILGTPAYMSPEQAQGAKDVDARTDLFSLGCMLYVLCTGDLPFKGETTMNILMALAMTDPVPPSDISETTPKPLSDLIMRLLEKKPENRPQTAKDVIEELTAIESELPRMAKSTSGTKTTQPQSSPKTATFARAGVGQKTATFSPAKFPKPKSRSAKPLVLVAVAMLLLIGGGFAAYKLFFETKDGTLIVEVDGDADVRFQKGELRIYGDDGNLKYTLKPSEKNKILPPGKYLVEVSGPDGLKLNTDKFEITRNGETKIRVTVDPKELAKTISNQAPAKLTPGGLRFAGPGSYLIQPAGPEIALDGPWTLEGWAYPEKQDLPVGTTTFLFGGGGGVFFLDITNEYNRGMRWYASQNVEVLDAYTSDLPIEFERWTHVAMVHDGKKIQLYVNGKKQSHANRGRLPAKLGPVGVGPNEWSATGGRPGYYGLLREVRISKVVRYQQDFKPAARFEPDADTLALCHLDEGQGDIYRDSSGNGHHGKIVGAKWVKADMTAITSTDPDRKVAEWVLSVGGKVTVLVGGQMREVTAIKDLPAGPLQVYIVVLSKIEMDTDAALERLKPLTKLTGLYLDNTKVGDASLVHLKTLTGLEALGLGNTNVTNAGLEHLRPLVRLRQIGLNYTKVTDAGLEHLKPLTELKNLGLGWTKVTADGVKKLSTALPGCKIESDHGVFGPKAEPDRKAAEWVLSIGSVVRVDEQAFFLKKVAELPSEPFRLTWIGLNNNPKATDAVFTQLQDCKNLMHIDLGGTKISDVGMSNFPDGGKLVYLSIGGTRIGDKGLAQIKACKKLTGLYLAGTDVGDEGLELLKELKALKSLSLKKTQVSADGVKKLSVALPDCKIESDHGNFGPKVE